jgi:hypothetical protein
VRGARARGAARAARGRRPVVLRHRRRFLLRRYKYVAMDTEFPGVVARPIGGFSSHVDYPYQTLRCNVRVRWKPPSAPCHAAPRRAAPSRAAVPSRAEPSRAAPCRAVPSRAEPRRAVPSRAEPRRAAPSRAVLSLALRCLAAPSLALRCLASHLALPC